MGGVNNLSLPPFPSACTRPSSVSISPHSYTPHSRVPERTGPQQSPTSPLPSGFPLDMSRPYLQGEKVPARTPSPRLPLLPAGLDCSPASEAATGKGGQPGWVRRLSSTGVRAQGSKKGETLSWEIQWADTKENLTPTHLPFLRTIMSCSTQSPQRALGQSLEVSTRTSLREGERVAGRPL